jgi:hypothetical protein
MQTILSTVARVLGAIFRGCGETAYLGLLGPIGWPSDAYRDASRNTTR